MTRRPAGSRPADDAGRLRDGPDHFWTPAHEWPLGDFGFVWGCRWGDDGSWKVPHPDLSRVREGVMGRDERFGYVELATHGHVSPAVDLDRAAAGNSRPPPFSSGPSALRVGVGMSGRPANGGRYGRLGRDRERAVDVLNACRRHCGRHECELPEPVGRA